MMLLILIINITTWDPSPLTPHVMHILTPPHVMHILTLFYTEHARSYITLLLKTVLFFFFKDSNMASTDKTRKRSVKQHNFNLKKSSFPQFSRLNSGFPFCLKRKTHIQVSEIKFHNRKYCKIKMEALLVEIQSIN